jgi:hypothetical protein
VFSVYSTVTYGFSPYHPMERVTNSHFYLMKNVQCTLSKKIKYLVAIGHRPMSYTRLEHDGPKAEEWRHSTVPTSGPASLQCMQTRDNHPRIQCKAVCIAVYQAWPLSGYITYSRSRPAAEHVVQQRGVILDKPILFYLLLHSFIAK